jgi:glutamine amidotransferase
MAHLRRTGLDQLLWECIQEGKPMLGICPGTQVILEHSEENDTTCLVIIAGNVKRFPENLRQDGKRLKIPLM